MQNNNNDLYNLRLASSVEQVDRENTEFYSRFPYPWPPESFYGYPPELATRFLNQDIGIYKKNSTHAINRIWVAGCGTNQAVFTALKFPECEVIATDVSPASLKIASHNAKSLGLKNLTLHEMSINQLNLPGEFDFIICTGVIHHNANPGLTLNFLKQKLKPQGVLELMVYNYYHRILTTAFQKGVRNFRSAGNVGYAEEMDIARRLVETFKGSEVMQNFLSSYHNIPDAKLADNLIQPVEHSYTVETFNDLVKGADLEILGPCPNRFDTDARRHSWNLSINDSLLRERYLELEDTTRWQISNLLLVDQSPMIWFYCQRNDSRRKRISEKEMCNEFLKTRFVKVKENLRVFLKEGETYKLQNLPLSWPSRPPLTDGLRKFLELLEEDAPIETAFDKGKIQKTFFNVNNVRLLLSTSENPFLLSTDIIG